MISLKRIKLLAIFSWLVTAECIQDNQDLYIVHVDPSLNIVKV